MAASFPVALLLLLGSAETTPLCCKQHGFFSAMLRFVDILFYANGYVVCGFFFSFAFRATLKKHLSGHALAR